MVALDLFVCCQGVAWYSSLCSGESCLDCPVRSLAVRALAISFVLVVGWCPFGQWAGPAPRPPSNLDWLGIPVYITRMAFCLKAVILVGLNGRIACNASSR